MIQNPTATPESEKVGDAGPTTGCTLEDDRDEEYFPRCLAWSNTDFSKHSVPYDEIIGGGPPRDSIPPIDRPKFKSVVEAADYLIDEEPVVSLEINGEAKAYPLAILVWHEIVNDEVGDVPVTITYCPLCNTAIVFDRRVGDRVLTFGTSGLLRNSDLVMWDRQTESWWQQITGAAIVGEMLGTRLTFIPSALVSWQEFQDGFPDGQVLTRDTGFSRDYDGPPYVGYDTLNRRPFLFRGEIDPRLQPMERVVGLSIKGKSIAYPFMFLEENTVVNDSIEGLDLVVFHTSETLSAFTGASNTENRVVGSAAVYEATVDGQRLTFKAQDGAIVDEETGSRWNVLGQAVEGPLAGTQLMPVIHANHFWFAWAAFYPDTEVRTTEDVKG